jgi:hypothetical protein
MMECATHLAIRFVRPEPPAKKETKCALLIGFSEEMNLSNFVQMADSLKITL